MESVGSFETFRAMVRDRVPRFCETDGTELREYADFTTPNGYDPYTGERTPPTVMTLRICTINPDHSHWYRSDALGTWVKT